MIIIKEGSIMKKISLLLVSFLIFSFVVIGCAQLEGEVDENSKQEEESESSRPDQKSGNEHNKQNDKANKDLSEETKESYGDSEHETSVKAYFPLHTNMTYLFDGEGVAYPSFEREIMYVSDSFMQVLDIGTGTNIVYVFEVKEDEVVLLTEEAEFYEETNLIEQVKENEAKDVLLKAPIKEGTTWETTERTREITAINKTITVPAGTFHDVLEVKIGSKNDDSDTVTYEYYAKNIGLIKQKTVDELGEPITESKLQLMGNK